MKRGLMALTFALIALSMPGCILDGGLVEDPGPSVTIPYGLSEFTKIEASSSFELDIEQGEEYFIEVTVSESVEGRLTIELEGDTLVMGLNDMFSLLLTNYVLEAVIVMPALEEIVLSGASEAIVSGFDSDADFNCQVSGASVLRGDIVAGDASFYISGASKVELTGSSTGAYVDVSGASEANLRDFVSLFSDVSVSGASKASVNVVGTLDCSVSGASRLYYYGSPSLGNLSVSGASKIEHG